MCINTFVFVYLLPWGLYRLNLQVELEPLIYNLDRIVQIWEKITSRIVKGIGLPSHWIHWGLKSKRMKAGEA